MTEYPTKCDGCGADLVFDPKTVSLKCPNCGNFVPLRLKVAQEKDYNEAEVNEQAWSREAKTIKCNSCGAIDIMNTGDMADVCPYCGSSNIIDSSENAGLVPNGIVPFSITKQEAVNFFQAKVKRNFWAPKDFKKSVQLDRLKSIFTPVFTFDSFAVGSYSGRLGKDETVRRRGFDGSYTTETETRWFNVSGDIRRRFDELVVAAGQKINSSIITDLEPYATQTAIEYNKVFLNGRAANSYKKDIKTCYEQATEMAKSELSEEIVKKHNADSVAKLDLNVDFVKTKYKYLLLPVYVSRYSYRNKNYNVYINGTTGKVAGKIPVSRKKVWGTILGVLLGIGAIAAAAILL